MAGARDKVVAKEWVSAPSDGPGCTEQNACPYSSGHPVSGIGEGGGRDPGGSVCSWALWGGRSGPPGACGSELAEVWATEAEVSVGGGSFGVSQGRAAPAAESRFIVHSLSLDR